MEASSVAWIKSSFKVHLFHIYCFDILLHYGVIYAKVNRAHIIVALKLYSSTQPGHPSVGHCSEYQHTVHALTLSVVLQHKPLSNAERYRNRTEIIGLIRTKFGVSCWTGWWCKEGCNSRSLPLNKLHAADRHVWVMKQENCVMLKGILFVVIWYISSLNVWAANLIICIICWEAIASE